VQIGWDVGMRVMVLTLWVIACMWDEGGHKGEGEGGGHVDHGECTGGMHESIQ